MDNNSISITKDLVVDLLKVFARNDPSIMVYCDSPIFYFCSSVTEHAEPIKFHATSAQTISRSVAYKRQPQNVNTLWFKSEIFTEEVETAISTALNPFSSNARQRLSEIDQHLTKRGKKLRKAHER